MPICDVCRKKGKTTEIKTTKPRIDHHSFFIGFMFCALIITIIVILAMVSK